MWATRTKGRYEAVATEEEGGVQVKSQSQSSSSRQRSCYITIAVSIVLVLLAGSRIVSFVPRTSDVSGDVTQEGIENPLQTPTVQPTKVVINEPTQAATLLEHLPSAPTSSCGPSLSIRREWRTLSNDEKDHYISSVRCLLEQPSALKPNSSSYDDFPFVHSRVGWYTHHAAPFLPWHRRFLNIYEDTLRSQCGFTGDLVYWDWTLDYADLASSSIFDPETGFGGNGDVSGEKTVGTTGHCVVDGPFSDVVAEYYDTKSEPHCLSRGFHDDEGNLGHIDGHDISPASIEAVLAAETYEAFVDQLEAKVHDVIPFGIGGDFETFTAPYDPLFFLHHTQLDRLWWMWQQRDPKARMEAYGGHNHRHSIEMANLDDTIEMKALAPGATVKQVMQTEGELLCYRY